MSKQKYRIAYEVIADNITEVNVIALEIFNQTHLEPSEIQMVLPWDRQQAIIEIKENRT